jgi:hypothetical protein
MKNKTDWIPIEELFDKMSEEEQAYALDNQFVYLYSKAEQLLLVGPEKYKKEDFFNEPRPKDKHSLDLIQLGCLQICTGKGLNKNNPLCDIGVFGFYDLMRMFHFDSVSRKTNHSFKYIDKSGALDEITFEHRIDKRKTKLFNFCEYTQIK